jgi:acetyl esterase/lipase
MSAKKILSIGIILMVFTSCATKKFKDISYTEHHDLKPLKLNVFTPRSSKNELKDVIIFIYGGNWNSGNKDMYGFMGRQFGKEDIVTVIPNYTLSPNANYDTMAQQVTKAITWTYNTIETYGGNPERIFITGHSAGAHLAALATMSPKYKGETSKIKGIILNDAAGLDMYSYLKENPPKEEPDNYVTTWTTNPKLWKEASPLYHIDTETPPIFTYLGTKTYHSIIEGNRIFREELLKVQPEAKLIKLDKKHVPMIVQYFYPWNKRAKEIKAFMNAN